MLHARVEDVTAGRAVHHILAPAARAALLLRTRPQVVQRAPAGLVLDGQRLELSQ